MVIIAHYHPHPLREPVHTTVGYFGKHDGSTVVYLQHSLQTPLLLG